jgi:hypothetical protein
MNDSALIDDVSFLDVESPRNRMLISFQQQLRKSQVAGRAADVDTNGHYFKFVYFHVFRGSPFRVQRSEIYKLVIHKTQVIILRYLSGSGLPPRHLDSRLPRLKNSGMQAQAAPTFRLYALSI